MRYTSIYSLVTNLCEAYKKEIGLRLNKWGVPFNINGKIKPQLKQLESNLKFAQHIIERKKTKLKNLKGNEEEIKGSSFLKQIIVVQEQLSVKIDYKKDSMEFLLVSLDRLKEKLEQQKKVNNG